MSSFLSSEICPCWQNLFGERLCKTCLGRIQKDLFPRSVRFQLDSHLELRSMSSYGPHMKEFIYLCKTALFNGFMPAQKTLLKELCAFWAPDLGRENIDALVAVPGHPFRTIFQSDLAWFLARYLAKELGKEEPLPVMKRKFFVGNKIYEPQKYLGKKERGELIREQYYVPKDSQRKGARVLLVDDVCTTGSTLRLCRDLLEDGGYKVHSAIVLSKVGR